MSNKRIISTLSEYKISYLQEFKARNSGLTIGPEKLYSVVENTMQNLRDPISLEDFLSFYNNDHITEIILPEEPIHLIKQENISSGEVIQKEFTEKNEKEEKLKPVLLFPSKAINKVKRKQEPIQTEKDNKRDPVSSKATDMFPYFIPSLISSGISLIVKEIYRSDELHVEYLFLVLGAIITVWFLYLFPAIIGGIIKLVTGRWNKKIYRILVIIQICGLWLRILLKTINL